MKSFSQFISEARQTNIVEENEDSSNLTPEQIREEYLAGNIFKEGTLVQKIDTEEIGTVTRRGANHLICVTEEGNMFRAWITDVREVFEVGTCDYRKHAQEYTPGQPVKKFSGKIKIKSSYK